MTISPERPTTLRKRIRPTRFGRMLHLYRTVQGQTLRDMAASTGISCSTLMRIEHGEAFDVATWMRLQTWLFGQESA